MAEGKVFRSNMWFSGFRCDQVGSPDVILSLNFDPEKREEYFCVDRNGAQRVGIHFNLRHEVNDLEFLATWSDPVRRSDACPFFREGLAAISRGDRLLIHCSAGRDRTGTFAAILQALAAETANIPGDGHLDAIECDYRRTKGLNAAKYGRMRAFLEDIIASGGVAQFLASTCDIPIANSLEAGRALLANTLANQQAPDLPQESGSE